MITLKSLLHQGTMILKEAGIEEASQDAWLLLEYTANISRAWYFAHGEEIVLAETEAQFLDLCRKRSSHIPLQHLTHRAWFMEYEFYVNEHVLIPRQDTETLVELARHHLKGRKDPRILDMCTGSGCILISLLACRKDGQGTGADLSPEALKVAKKNASALGVEHRIQFLESDLFSHKFFSGKDGNTPPVYDMLVSNPPYIATDEIESLMEEVRFHDPRMALDGHGDGLYFYREITGQAKKYLKPGGWLLYEVGCTQGRAVADMLKAAGFVSVEIKKDLAGLDRVVLGQLPEKDFAHQEEAHV